MRLLRLLVLAVASWFGFLFFLQTSTPAQQTASISGTLTDPSEAAIVGAVVTAQPLDAAGRSVHTETGPEGKYSLTLSPGRYRVRLQHPAFQTEEQELTLAPGNSRTWDVRLQLQPMSADVVVSASAEPATIENTAALVNIVTREQIDQRGEIWLTPLTQGIPGMSFSQLGPLGGSTTFFLDGGNSSYTKVLIDGVPVNQPGGQMDFSNFSLDGIDKI